MNLQAYSKSNIVHRKTVGIAAAQAILTQACGDVSLRFVTAWRSALASGRQQLSA